MMSTVQSDIFKTNSASSSIKSAVETCNNVSKPDKDESTTVSGNNNAHSVIDDLISKNQSVAEAIRTASDSIQKVGDEFHFAKRRSTEALYEQQQQIQHGIRKAEEEMIDLEMRRNIEIEMVTKEENKWKQ